MARRDRRALYGWTWLALMGLLAATVVLAYLPLGRASVVVALGIALAKTLLVGLFFMHLSRRSGVTRVFAVGGFVWLALLFAFTLADYATRGRASPSGHVWSEDVAPPGAPLPQPERRPDVRRVIHTDTVLDR